MNELSIVGRMSLLAVVLLIVLTILPTVANAQSCIDVFDCPATNEEYVCEEGQCQKCSVQFDDECPGDMVAACTKCVPCRTSAQCLEKTFAKAGLPSPWAATAFLAVIISFMASGLVWVMGRSFGSRRVEKLGKAEVMQSIASLVLVMLLFTTTWSSVTLVEAIESQTGQVTASLFGKEGEGTTTFKINPFEVVYAFQRKLVGCAERMYRSTVSEAQIYEFLGSFQLQVYVGLNDVSGSSGVLFETPPNILLQAGGIAQKISEKQYLADELTWLIIMNHALLNFTRFIETSMFTVFLPIGILLRAFPPSRGAGAVLIAIAIGLYVVYPMIYVILYLSTSPTVEGCSVQIAAESATVSRKVCPLSTAQITEKVLTSLDEAPTLDINAPIIKSGATSLRYLSFLYFMIAIGGTFIFIRSTSGILGADISEIGRSMMKML